MKRIGNSSEDEMILEFLSMEFQSDRWREDILKALRNLQADRTVILHGDISDPEENLLRKKILGEFRGYGKNADLFERFPVHVRWEWTLFENSDLSRIRYINYSYWNELSKYTGSPLEAAQTILANRTIYGVPNDGFLAALESLKKGIVFSPLIMLTDDSMERYIVLEGHKRMTAYALAPELFQNVKVLLGYCRDDDLIRWYGEMPIPGGIS